MSASELPDSAGAAGAVDWKALLSATESLDRADFEGLLVSKAGAAVLLVGV
jgi:hypothetical protein